MSSTPTKNKKREEKIKEWKQLVADERNRIKLHDEVVKEIKEIIEKTGEEYFSVNDELDNEEFRRRISEYEKLSLNLCNQLTLISYWGTHAHDNILRLPFQRYASSMRYITSGKIAWVNLKWYVLYYLLYSVGVVSIASGNLLNIRRICELQVTNVSNSRIEEPLILTLVSCVIRLSDDFGRIYPEIRNRTPISDYLYKKIKDDCSDIVYMGEDYDQYFDKFEMLLSLEYVHKKNPVDKIERIWGPVGRFSWKYHLEIEKSPLYLMMAEAENYKNQWPPIKAGFFGGNYDRFKNIAYKFKEKLREIHW